MSTLAVGTIKGVSGSLPPVVQNSSGTEIGYFAKAWIVFNGSGTVSINDSKNISTLTDEGTGKYKVAFTNSMPSDNYVPIGQALVQNGQSDTRVLTYNHNSSPPWSASEFQFENKPPVGSNNVDAAKVAVAFIG